MAFASEHGVFFLSRLAASMRALRRSEIILAATLHHVLFWNNRVKKRDDAELTERAESASFESDMFVEREKAER